MQSQEEVIPGVAPVEEFPWAFPGSPPPASAEQAEAAPHFGEPTAEELEVTAHLDASASDARSELLAATSSTVPSSRTSTTMRTAGVKSEIWFGHCCNCQSHERHCQLGGPRLLRSTWSATTITRRWRRTHLSVGRTRSPIQGEASCSTSTRAGRRSGSWWPSSRAHVATSFRLSRSMGG